MAKTITKAAPKEENVLISVTLKDHNNEDVTINVPKDYMGARDNVGSRLTIDYGDNLIERMDSIFEVIGMIESDREQDIHFADGEMIYSEDYEQEEDGSWRPMSQVELFEIVLKEFKSHGYCYRYIGYDCMNVEGETDLRLVPHGSRIVKDGAEVFSAKYAVGTRAFYHANSSEDLKASKIDTIIIKHKCGYNVSTEYLMTDGRTVKEDSVLMKDKALEWVNARG